MSASTLSNTTAPDWAAAARDYAAGALTVAEICALHGINRAAFYRRAQRDGWPPRVARKPRRRGRKRQIDLAKRLLIALDQKMTDFETRIAAGAATAADSERDARTLNTLVRLFEKLKGFGEKGASAAKAAASPSAIANPAETHPHDADRLRHDLAQRLEKLRQGMGG